MVRIQLRISFFLFFFLFSSACIAHDHSFQQVRRVTGCCQIMPVFPADLTRWSEVEVDWWRSRSPSIFVQTLLAASSTSLFDNNWPLPLPFDDEGDRRVIGNKVLHDFHGENRTHQLWVALHTVRTQTDIWFGLSSVFFVGEQARGYVKLLAFWIPLMKSTCWRFERTLAI